MSRPKITVLLCTVRPDHGYVEHPEWKTCEKVVDDLVQQTFKDFELVVVDGLCCRGRPMPVGLGCNFNVRHMSPRQTYWVRNKKVAISAYRNTGLIHARGELIVNLDDCCELPPDYLEHHWEAYQRGYCLSPTWAGDGRQEGIAEWPQSIWGFSSYPLEAAVGLNGYDEAFDGSQGLEDLDWSFRLAHVGIRWVLVDIPGFRIHEQSAHDPRVVDGIAKCCNVAWNVQRNRMVKQANRKALWEKGAIGKLVPHVCPLLKDGNCGHHGHRVPCGYLPLGWPDGTSHPLWSDFVCNEVNWPVLDLAKERRKCQK